MFYLGTVYYFGYGATPLQQQMTRNEKRSEYWFAQSIKHGIEESAVASAKAKFAQLRTLQDVDLMLLLARDLF